MSKTNILLNDFLLQEIFVYKDDDFIFTVPCTETYSIFDKKLQLKWNEKLDEGVFRYRLNITKEKFLENKFYLQVRNNKLNLLLLLSMTK